MKHLFESIKTILIRGILFFIPLIVLIIIMEKAFKLSKAIMGPIVRFIEVRDLFGLGVEIVIAIALIVIIILLGGLLSRTTFAHAGISKIENTILSKLPGYSIIKGMSDNIASIEEEGSLKTVIAEVDDGWKFGFLSEELDDGKSAVFLPDAPNPWSGSLVYLNEEQITRIDIPITSAIKFLSSLGKGSNELLKDYFHDANSKNRWVEIMENSEDFGASPKRREI